MGTVTAQSPSGYCTCEDECNIHGYYRSTSQARAKRDSARIGYDMEPDALCIQRRQASARQRDSKHDDHPSDGWSTFFCVCGLVGYAETGLEAGHSGGIVRRTTKYSWTKRT